MRRTDLKAAGVAADYADDADDADFMKVRTHTQMDAVPTVPSPRLRFFFIRVIRLIRVIRGNFVALSISDPARVLALLLAVAGTATAQYSVDWHTMDAGGGSGTAGSYEMRGTLGQPDAFTGAAGSVALVGGYWSLLDEPAPLLRIFKVGADIVLAWPNPSPGFSLQASPDLVTGAWSAVTIAPVKVGGEFQVTWGPPIGRHFFRLHRP